MTCNAFRFGLSTIILVAFLPIIPADEPKVVWREECSLNDTRDTILPHNYEEIATFCLASLSPPMAFFFLLFAFSVLIRSYSPSLVVEYRRR